MAPRAFLVRSDGVEVEMPPLWSRLRVIEVRLPQSERDRLADLQCRLTDSPDRLTQDDLVRLRRILARLLASERALAAIGVRNPRPERTDRPFLVAVDYLARVRLNGRGRIKQILHDVAAAWDIRSDRTVQDYNTNFGGSAKYKIDELVRQFDGTVDMGYSDGRPPVYRTQKSVLQAIVDSLGDWRTYAAEKARSSGPKGRKKRARFSRPKTAGRRTK